MSERLKKSCPKCGGVCDFTWYELPMIDYFLHITCTKRCGYHLTKFNVMECDRYGAKHQLIDTHNALPRKEDYTHNTLVASKWVYNFFSSVGGVYFVERQTVLGCKMEVQFLCEYKHGLRFELNGDLKFFKNVEEASLGITRCLGTDAWKG